jgi:hypothetical protein
MHNIKVILQAYNAAYQQNPVAWEFLEEAKKYSLNGVHKPWWQQLPNFDICWVLSPNMVHRVHKMFL